jgi:ParB family transcriptional regulator, chromosome partitioning protein
MNAENSIDEVDGKPSIPAEESPGVDPAVPTAASPAVEPSAAAAVEPAPPPVSEAPAPPPAPRRGHVAPAHIPLDRIDEDTTFQIRAVGELSALATDLARLGQLLPVDVRFKPPDRFQIISGFRRVAALRFLKRDRVLARLHTDLSDEDALLMALASAIHASPVSEEDLRAQRARLETEGRLTPIARDMLDKALAPDDSLAPELVEQEVDADELAVEATQRLVDINQDLALLADVFPDLDETRKQELLTQLRYSSDLVAWLEKL